MDLDRERRLYELLQQVLATRPDLRASVIEEFPDLDTAERARLFEMTQAAADDEARDRQEASDPAADRHARAANNQAKSPVEGTEPSVTIEGGGAPDPDFASAVLRRLAAREGASGRYSLKGEVARGGQGVVLRVWDEDLRRNLAMKVMLGRGEAVATGNTPPADPRSLGRFLEEAQVTGQLDHPGIVPVHELGLDSQGRVFFTMKLVKGEDLKAVFARVHAGEPEWTQTRALSILLRVCEAMSYAHSKRVIHRDLKPSNIMVGRYGEVFVMDWGLARMLDRKDDKDVRVRPQADSLTSDVHSERRERAVSDPDSPLLTMDGDVVGTPAYMSPEQASGHQERMGPPSDVYALGAMLYQLITGRMPYVTPDARVNNYAILSRVQEGPPVGVVSLTPKAPAELVAVCEKAMARDPADRYEDMSALAKDMRAYLERRVVAAFETGTWAETRKWVLRNKFLATALLSVISLLAIAVEISRQSNARLRSTNTDLEMVTANLRQNQSALDLSLYRGALSGIQEARRIGDGREVRRLLELAPQQLRGWEWKYLRAVTDASEITLEGFAPAFSPVTHELAVIGSSVIRILDIDTSACTRSIPFPIGCDYIGKVEFSLDGKRLVANGTEGSEYAYGGIWDLNSSDLLRNMNSLGYSGRCDVGLSADGKEILVASNTYTKFDTLTGDGIGSLDALGYTQLTDFSSDGHFVVSPDDPVGLRLARFDGQQATTTHLDTFDSNGVPWDERHLFAPKGSRFLAWVPFETCVQLWEATTASRLAVFNGTGLPISCAFTRDAEHIVIQRSDGTVQVWRTSDSRLIDSWAVNGPQFVDLSLGAFRAMSPDGSLCLSPMGASPVLWPTHGTSPPRMLEGHQLECNLSGAAASSDERDLSRASFNRDGTWLATDADGIRLWRMSKNPDVLMNGGSASCVAHSPDGTRIATASGAVVTLWDDLVDAPLRAITVPFETITYLEYSPDGTYLLITTESKCAYVLDGVTGETVRCFGDDHDDGVSSSTLNVNSASFVDQGTKLLIQPYHDATLRIIDIMTGDVSNPLSVPWPADKSYIRAVVLSGDRSRVAVVTDVQGTESPTLFIFAFPSMTPLTRTAGIDGFLAFSHNCRRGVVTRNRDGSPSGEGSLIDFDTPGQEVSLSGEGIDVAAFSQDDGRIFTSSQLRSSASIWDLTGARLLRLNGHEAGIVAASLSADGSQFVTSADDGMVRLWNTVCNRDRHALRLQLGAANSEAEVLVQRAKSATQSSSQAADWIRRCKGVDAVVLRAALNRVTQQVASDSSRMPEGIPK